MHVAKRHTQQAGGGRKGNWASGAQWTRLECIRAGGDKAGHWMHSSLGKGERTAGRQVRSGLDRSASGREGWRVAKYQVCGSLDLTESRKRE